MRLNNFVWLKGGMCLSGLFDILNSADHGCRETFLRFMGITDMREVRIQINEGSRANLHPFLKDVTSALKAFEKANECQYELFMETSDRLCLLKNGKRIPLPLSRLKATPNRFPLQKLLSCKSQGRFIEIMQQTPHATRLFIIFIHPRAIGVSYTELV